MGSDPSTGGVRARVATDLPAGQRRYRTGPREAALRLVPIEEALGAVQLANHVVGTVVDLP
jgi:hypothetical protein